MGRLIDEQTAYNVLTDYYHHTLGIQHAALKEALGRVETVDAVPVVHGRWKAVKDGEDDYRRICSCCGEDAPYDESDDCYLIYPHCPWCGAKMDEDGGDNEKAD